MRPNSALPALDALTVNVWKPALVNEIHGVEGVTVSASAGAAVAVAVARLSAATEVRRSARSRLIT